jgi:hypothetical protein
MGSDADVRCLPAWTNAVVRHPPRGRRTNGTNRDFAEALHLTRELQSAEPLPTPVDGDPFEAWPRGVLAVGVRVDDVEIGPS